jgi:cyclophilin family peptidyl-prolyl cis-trans isomerase
LTPAEHCAAADPIQPSTRQFTQPEAVLAAGVNYQAILCTDFGPVYVDLYEDQTPATVNNFVFLAQQGFYDASLFHRVIQGFMAQAGDPVGNPPGTGGPGYQFGDEPRAFLTFDRPGLLAMANAGPATNGSQFFITTVPTDWLNYRHTIFGEVLEGQEVVASLPDNQADPNIQTGLQKVIIITDPASVTSTYQAPARASNDEVQAILNNYPNLIPAALDTLAQGLSGIVSLNTQSPLVLTAEEWVLTLNGYTQTESPAAYYAAHPIEYHATLEIVNGQCALDQFPIAGMSYNLDVFPSTEAAAAAFADPQLEIIQAELGYASFGSIIGLRSYSQGVELCGGPLLLVRSISQQGRYIITTEVVFVEGVFADPSANVELSGALLVELAGQIFEGPLSGVLEAEIAY